MNENLNLVEILKDCPRGTKLYSIMWGEVELEELTVDRTYPIVVKTKTKQSNREDLATFTSSGMWSNEYNGECMLFPSKDQRDWSKFKPKKTIEKMLDMKKIEIEIPDGKRAEWVNGVLTLVDDTPKDITERIKTFEDACAELGNEHPFVKSYEKYVNIASDEEDEEADVIAYLKLRIIVAALNEGWTPKFTEDERRWYPWHYLWTESKLAEKSDDWKADRHLIMIGNKYQSEYAGLTFAHSGYAPSHAHASVGFRLCLKSEALATYCGKQFINLWTDFCLIKK